MNIFKRVVTHLVFMHNEKVLFLNVALQWIYPEAVQGKK